MADTVWVAPPISIYISVLVEFYLNELQTTNLKNLGWTFEVAQTMT